MKDRILDALWDIRFGAVRLLLRICLIIIGKSGVDLVAEAAGACIEKSDRELKA